jgi:hypothetical protein
MFKIKGYRTFLVQGLTFLCGALALTDWNEFFHHPTTGIALIVVAVINAYMRTITDTPPGEPVHPAEEEKKPKPPFEPKMMS